MYISYLIIIFLCLAFSIIHKTARQRFLYLYFGVVFVSEILIFIGIFDGSIYKYTKGFYILFFIFYFKELFKLNYNSYVLLFIVITCLLIKNVIGDENLLPVIQSFVYVFLSLEWMIQQIKNPNEISIYNKQKFWFCAGLLLWSSIFLMRIVPSLFFAEKDMIFFQGINHFYQGITIFCYTLFLRGIFCKI
ncbi:hypothetical protein SAMN05444360_10314 [Chryseobacterium carnipullorum]|nr:hypothetical protein SAMN05444360_10314 [Chryseobacterium carnipullorum]